MLARSSLTPGTKTKPGILSRSNGFKLRPKERVNNPESVGPINLEAGRLFEANSFPFVY
jgi:hypothetical protein